MKSLVRNQKCLVSVLLALLIVFGTFSAADVQAQNAVKPRTVQLFYFLPKDRPYRQEVVDRMKTGILQVQSFFADQMESHGYGRMTFSIETDGNGDPVVHRVNGAHADSHYTKVGSPGNEIGNAFDTSSTIQLVVMDISKSSGGQGTGVKERGYAVIHGRWNKQVAEHELGHAWGLQHDFRDDSYVMSYGNHRDTLSAGAARYLSVNPYFNNSIPLQAGAAPSVELLSSTDYPYGVLEHVPVRLRVRDPDGIQQVTLLINTPEGTNFLYTPGFFEVIEYRNLSGETDVTVTFNYEGNTPSLGGTDLLNTLRHTIYVTAVDSQGNRINYNHARSWTLQAVNVPKPKVPLSERSPRVAESIYEVVRRFHDQSVSSYDDIRSPHLAQIKTMFVNRIRASDSLLQANDFDGLTNLNSLELRFESGYSESTLLPAGIFKGLTSLSSVKMKYYTDTYGEDTSLYPRLPFPIGLKKVGEGRFKAVVHTGAPFDIEDLPLIVVNGSFNGGATSVSIPAGSVESEVLTVTRTPGTTAAVVVDFESIVARHPFGGFTPYRSSYPLEVFSPLPGAPTPVPDRTPQIIEAIVGEVPEIDHTAHNIDPINYMINGQFVKKKYNAGHYVSEAHLAAITNLNAVGGSGTTFDNIFGGLTGNWFRQLGDITALKPGDFDGMPNLEGLYLSSNKLSALPNSTFDKLTNLERLDLSSNELSALPTGLFDKLTNLTVLSLFNNDFSSLPNSTFDKLTNLEKLNLSSNNFSSLPAGLFDKLINLTYLNLLDNPLRSIPDGYFDKLTNLETLFLPPTITPPTLPGVNSITSVANRTPQVRDAIVAAAGVNSAANVTAGHLAAITELDLSENGITALKSGDFDNLTNLEGLGIGGTFSSLPNGIFDHLVSLEALVLTSTQLSSLPDGIFDKTTSLALLYIIGSKSMDDSGFLIDSSLLPNNQMPLRSLPDGIFDHLTNLQGLLIIGTQLSSLPTGIFDHLTNVPAIVLMGNRLRSLPAGIFDKATMTLDLSSNQLRSLPDGIFKGIFDELPDLTGFNLLGIPLGQVPAGGLDNTEYTTINLTGNPVDPLPLTISLERVGNGQFKAVAPAGAPFELVLPIRVANGAITGGATSVTIPVGRTESDTFTVTRASVTTFDVPVDIGTLPALWSNHSGYILVKSADLPLVFPGTEVLFSISGRTPEVQDAIVKAVPGVNAAGDVTEAHLAAITELGVRLSDSVKVYDFNGLTGLTALDVFTGQLTSLPTGLFNDLDNLTYLVVRGTQLTTLPTGMFDGLTKLDTLGLLSRQLSSLPAGIFDNLTNLTALEFGELNTLPAGIFDNLTNLTSLITVGAVNPLPLTVSLEKVADGQFKAVALTGAPFDIVLPLTVTNGSISGGATTVTIPAGSVESGTLTVTRTPGTTAAITANIGTLPSLPSGHRGYALVKSSNLPLAVINAEGVVTNSAPVFTDGASTTRSIAENTAANINIGTAIAATDADTGDTLTYTLSGADATSFSIVSTTGQLKTKAALDYETKFSYTVTVTVSDGNDGSDSITVTINVTDVTEGAINPPLSQRTRQVRDAIVAAAGVNSAADVTAAHLAAITSLNLTRKGITSLKTGDFDGLTALTLLSLISNSISDISAFEDLTTLKNLYLSGNSISDISALENLTALTSLNLGGNSISNVSALENLTALTSLNLGGNSISNVSALENLTSMERLGLQHNSISNISALENLTALTSLSLDENSISDISVLENLTALVYLKLGQNFISDVSALEGLISLEDLDLKNNLISDYGPLRRLKAAKPNVNIDIDINNNPPVFSEGASTTRSIAENTPSWRNIGAPISATDADNDGLVYRLRGTDAASFQVGLKTGQLQNRASVDYETKNTYSVTIVVEDGNGGGDSIDVTINVTDVPETNSAPTFTDGTTATRTIAENTAAGQHIGTAIAATDTDTGDTLTYTLGGTGAVAFSIDSTTGQLETKADLDYETKTSYAVTVTVSDGNGGSDSITVTINITDVNENNPPVFTDGTTVTRSIAENTAANTNIGTAVAATDADTGDTLTYTLGGTDAASFSIVSTTGQLKTKATLDYETKTSYSVTISVSDGNGGSDAIDVTINVTDVNENNPPVFTDGTTATRSIAENTAANTNIGTAIAATDTDTGDTLTYTLSGTDAASFSIVSTTGQLKTKAALDYETKTSYSVTVSVSDGNGGSDSVTVTINVTDVNENNPPVFTDGTTATRSIAENTAANTNIGTAIAATDADTADTLTYTLSGTDAAAFSIDSTTGDLKTKAALDYETKNSYTVTVTVSDGKGGSDSITVTINVTDVNENNAPVFTEGTSATRTVLENIPTNTKAIGTAANINIGTPITATDADNDTLTYTLGGTDAASFAIDSTSGQLQTKAALDYETKASYSLTITVSDGNGGSDSITVTINVTDVNENNPPVFTDGTTATRTIAENTAANTNIGTAIAATDADNDTLTYTLGGTDAASFSIVSTTGQLQTKAALDYETKAAYTVTVSVSDGNGGSDSITVTINVTDVNENNPPVFTDGATATRTIAENTAAGQNIGTAIAATDGDTADTLTYTLGGTDAASFSIVSTSGQLQTKAALDYETKTSYSVTISVSDGNGGSDSITVTINVTDVNENNAPIFTDGTTTTRSIAENTAANTNIGTAITATDADNDTLTYTLGGTDAASFSIVSTTGQLQTKAALDYETKTSYAVTITVSDGKGGSDSITVTINVTDINENTAPVFTDGATATRTIAENTAAGQNIGTAIAATDGDTADTLTYSLSGTDAAAFSIVSTTGQLQTSAALDYETKTSYSVTITVSDGNGGSDSITVTINLTDVNENNAPVFSAGNNITITMELPPKGNTEGDYDIGEPLSAIDPDGSTVIFYSLSGTDAGLFHTYVFSKTVNGQKQSYVQLTTRGWSLHDANKSSFTVIVTASDRDGGSNSITVTINVTAETQNNAPVFTDGTSTTRTVAENTAANINIGTAIAATDADNDTLTYTLSGTDAASFSIVSTTGQLQTKAALDYETKTSYALTITVSDGSLTDTITLTINVTDIEETIVTIPGICQVGDVLAPGESCTYPGTDAEFSVSNNGIGQFLFLTAADNLNIKDTNINGVSYTLVAKKLASGSWEIEQVAATAAQTVNTPPVFTDGTTATRSIAENTAAGQHIGTAIAATDADTGDTLTYTLSGTDAASFGIDTTTGQLKTKAALDYETKTSYTVTVTVSDGSGGSDSINVTINVTDVNENRAPVFADGGSTTRSIAENTAANTNIGTAIAATDADNDTLTYTLSGTDATSFSIVSTSGQLKTRAALDYETKTSYALTITVSDGSLTDTISVTINITDINELPTTTAICKVGDVLAPGESCTYPGTEAVFSVLDDGKSQWNIPNLPALLQWVNQTSVSNSMNVSTTVNGQAYHFVAEELAGNSWEIKEIADDTSQQPDTPEQPGNTGGTPTPTTSTTGPLTEATLNGGIITLSIDNQIYEASVFKIRDAVSVTGIPGVTIDSVERVSDLVIAVKLAFNGNIATDGTLTFTVNADAIADYTGPAFTAQTSIPAVTESVVASTAAPLTEATLDESIVTLTLSGRKFERSNFDIRDNVAVSGISGVTVRSFDIDRESDTEVTVELTFNGNLNADGTLTFTVGADAIAGYNGSTLTTQVAVSASTEAPEVPEPPVVTQKPIESNYDHIEGPWLWMIAPGGDIDIDNLSEASDGVITETQIAQTGVNEGDIFNELQWTSGRLLPTTVCGIFLCSSDNVINVVREIGLTDRDQLNAYSAYALINISSPRVQNNVLMGVGSDDSIKVWLNGSVVYENDVSRRTTGIQNRFPVNLNAGNNLLLIKVCNHGAQIANNDWGMFFKLYLDTQDYTLSLPTGGTGGQQPQTPQQPQQPVNTGAPPTLTVSTASPLTEATLDESVVTLTLSEAKYERSIWSIRDAVSVSGIAGVTIPWTQPERKSDTQITIELEFDGDMTTDGTLTFTVDADAIAGYNGPALTVQVSVSASTDAPADTGNQNPETPQQPGNTGGTPTLTASTASPLTEATLDESIVTLTLSGAKYERSTFDIRDNVTVSSIAGVTIPWSQPKRKSNTQITVELEFDGDMTTDGTLTFTVGPDAIAGYNGPALTVQVAVSASTDTPKDTGGQNPDPPETPQQPGNTGGTPTLSVSTAAPLTEATLDESIVTLTLSGAKYERSTFDIRDNVTVSGIAGVTIPWTQPKRKSNTQITVELEFDGDMTTDGTLTFTVGPDAIAGYNGPALTVQVSVSASTDAPADTGNQNPETPQQPGNTGGTPTLTVSTASPLTEATLHGSVVTLTLSGGTYERSTWDIEDAVSVAGISGVTFDSFFGLDRVSNTKVTIELEFSGNMTTNGTLTFTVDSDGIQDYNGAALTAQIQVTANTESVAASTASPLKEATLDESVVTLTLSGAKYASSIWDLRGNVTVSGITGVTIPWNQPERKSDTEITIELEFDGDMTTDGTLTFTVGADAIAGYNGPALTAQVSVSVGDAPADAGDQNPDPPETPQQPGNQDSPQQPGNTGGNLTLTASTTSALTEAALHGSVVTLTLNGGAYERSTWDLEDAVSVSGISGVTFDSFFGLDRVSNTKVTIELEFSGNITSNGTLTFTVDSDGIQDYNGAALTAQIQVTANTESVAASTTAPLKEATLDGSVVTLTLSGTKYASSIWDIRDAVSVAGINGVTIPWNQPKRKSDTQITVELEFDGDMTTDGTLTFTVGADAIAGYNGPALTTQITVTADRENALLANFPNPFNPETWIPYQLEKPTEVTITIYNINGHVVRTLELGHQPAGIYRSRSRAAYWDGRNQFGEPVASGVYFYRITAGDFTATRKMLIRK